MKKLFTFLFLTTVYLLLTTNSYAQYGCESQYGGCPPSQSILIDKTVQLPDANSNKDASSYSYVDNLSPSDPRFQAAWFVWFKLRVKNTSSVAINGIMVKDFVPSYLNPVLGPGTFDNVNRLITFSAGDFGPGEEKIYYLKMQVMAVNQLPADKGLFCVINKASASNSMVYDDDTSQLCIEKQVTSVKQAPKAGPEMGIVLFSGEVLTLGIGLFLKKRFSR